MGKKIKHILDVYINLGIWNMIAYPIAVVIAYKTLSYAPFYISEIITRWSVRVFLKIGISLMAVPLLSIAINQILIDAKRESAKLIIGSLQKDAKLSISKIDCCALNSKIKLGFIEFKHAHDFLLALTKLCILGQAFFKDLYKLDHKIGYAYLLGLLIYLLFSLVSSGNKWEVETQFVKADENIEEFAARYINFNHNERIVEDSSTKKYFVKVPVDLECEKNMKASLANDIFRTISMAALVISGLVGIYYALGSGIEVFVIFTIIYSIFNMKGLAEHMFSAGLILIRAIYEFDKIDITDSTKGQDILMPLKSESIIRLDNVSWCDSVNGKTILNHVSGDFLEGEINLVLYSDIHKKEPFINIILNETSPMKGKIIYNEIYMKDKKDTLYNSHMRILWDRTVLQNILFKNPNLVIKGDVLEIFKDFEIGTHIEDKNVLLNENIFNLEDLIGEDLRKIILARAILSDKSVILLDYIDFQMMGESFMTIIPKLSKKYLKGKTLILLSNVGIVGNNLYDNIIKI